MCLPRLVGIFLAVVSLAHAREVKRVDGVPVYGNLHDIQVVDLRNAIKLGEGRGGVSKLEVLNHARIKVYLRPRDRGYIEAGRFAGVEYDGSRSHNWSFGPFDVYDPEGLNIIRGADEVFVFPNRTPDEPHRDNKHMRLLSGDARREIVQLLGNERNWFHGFDDFLMLGREPRNIGLLFRRGKDEVVLFLKCDGRAEGTINGQHVENALKEKRRKQIDNWLQRYARPELTAK
jgi:hypothetical protein